MCVEMGWWMWCVTHTHLFFLCAFLFYLFFAIRFFFADSNGWTFETSRTWYGCHLAGIAVTGFHSATFAFSARLQWASAHFSAILFTRIRVNGMLWTAYINSIHTIESCRHLVKLGASYWHRTWHLPLPLLVACCRIGDSDFSTLPLLCSNPFSIIGFWNDEWCSPFFIS